VERPGQRRRLIADPEVILPPRHRSHNLAVIGAAAHDQGGTWSRR
jgi:hypothetical protein